MTQEILTAIGDAELVLVGIGEEFDEFGIVRSEALYQKGRERLAQEDKLWLLPYYESCYRKDNNEEQEQKVLKGLTQLSEVLKDKNYFVVSSAMNHMIAEVPWKEGRLVMPCGGTSKKQCTEGCEGSLQELTEVDKENITAYLKGMLQEVAGKAKNTGRDVAIDVCPKCGKPLIVNNVYAEKYDESGYLSQWQLYTKWLQGTLNKKLVILELGVGMKFPSVIRFPFEKVAYFNQKAYMYRVNERLYHLSEELKGKGTAINKNSVDWLDSLC